MSVRRLADETVQPESFAFSKANQAWAEKKMAEYPPGRQQSAVIPVLWRAQEQEGWISRAAIETIAKLLDMPYIRVLEVATFYTQFLLRPVGTRAHILICGTTPCMLRGAEDLREVCQHKINHAPFETNAEGTMSWEEVECLGACVNAPMVMIGNDTYEDLTVESFETLVDKFAAGKGSEVKPGPQVERQFGAAEGGQTTLLEKPTAKRTYKPFPPPPAPAPAPGAATAPAAAAPAAKPAEAPKAPVAAPRLFEAPAGQPDDLKLISGVGPVLEGKLNAIGITTWAQVAGLKKADIAKLEDHLAFPGRVARDEWIKQAKALAKGGVEEYRKVFGKDPR
jgi:NADH-quinone oxidoreductase subunit E